MDRSDILNNKTGLMNYYYFSEALMNDIEKIKELANNYSEIDANVAGNIDKTYRSSQIRWIPYDDSSKWLYEKCKNLAVKANKTLWNFNITNIKEDLQFTEYNADKEGHYDWHVDVGDRVSTRKISMTVQLSDPSEYEGGDLEFMVNRSILKAPKTKGTAIFFPSYLQHRVTKVTSGTRNSLVIWFHGPPFV
jgi:PKHD-type hydroxylase